MAGVNSKLYISTEYKNGNTIISDSFFNQPFKIAKPIYNEFDEMEVYIMNASAGILENDNYEINLDIGKNTRVNIKSQSYTKIFKMIDGMAKQKITANISEGAVLKYMPMPIMPFIDSVFYSEATFNIEKGGSLIYSDILSCGRYGMGESFLFKKYRSRVVVNYDGKIVFLDNILLEPGSFNMNSIGFYEGYTHQGAMFFCSEKIDIDDKVYKYMEQIPNIEFGITRTHTYGLLLRVLGKSSESLKVVFENIIEYFY